MADIFNISTNLNVSGNTIISGTTTFLNNVTLSGSNGLISSGITATTISATTYQNLPSQSGTGVSSLSFTPNNGILTLTKNNSSTLTAGTFTYLTGISYSNNVITSTNNTGGISTFTINTLTGLTVNGNLTVTGTTISSTFSGSTYQNLPVSGVTNGTGISTSTTNGLVTISNTGVTSVTATSGLSGSSTIGGITLINTDLGSSQNIFKNIQAGGVTQFSAGSNSANLNFSGINISITSAATNTLVFSAGTGGSTFTGGTVSGATTFTGGLTANTISATTYSNLPFSGTVRTSGTTTSNYIPRFTGTTTLTNSQIRDDGTNIGIGIAPNVLYKTSIYSATNIPLFVQNQSSNSYSIYGFSNGAYSQTGIYGLGYGSTDSTGVVGAALDGNTAIGVKGTVDVSEFGTVVTGIGGYFDGRGFGSYSYPLTSYSVQLVDGTEGTNKVLISTTSDGKANWSDTLTGLTNVRSTTISATTYQNLPVSAVTNGTGISTSTTNGIATITNTDLGSSQNIFKNIQIAGVTQFSAGSNSANLNFSGLNMTITSAATNTLVFSSGIKNIQTTSDGTAITNTTTSTLTSSVLIPANTVSVGDIINIRARIRKTGTGGTVILRFYINTSAAIGGSLVGTSTTAAATTLYMQIPRTLAVKSSTNTETFQAGGTSTLDDTIGTGAVASNNISWTSAQYLVVAVQNASLTDSTVCSFIHAQINKQ